MSTIALVVPMDPLILCLSSISLLSFYLLTPMSAVAGFWFSTQTQSDWCLKQGVCNSGETEIHLFCK